MPLAAYPNLPVEAFAGKTILSTGNYYPFNNILFHYIPNLAHSTPRTALAIAGDNDEAKTRIAAIVDALGFDTIDAGTLAESWRFEPDSGAYTPIYAADLEGMKRDYLGEPRSACLRRTPRGATRRFTPPRRRRATVLTATYSTGQENTSGTPEERPDAGLSRGSGLVGGVAAVDDQFLTGDESGLVGREIQDAVSDV
ncbi:hypothetical protein [Arthrobacter sp. PGP41]|uniref:hypothetical protein n=1 Tax=Arthrobacter sp. PGP41 TaxID=2079227 RepID=UPI0018F86E65|nr:hypothetical protein [Arthrobacter sp. PGP41]